MNTEEWDWPADDMDFFKIKNDAYRVEVNWSGDYFEDYKRLSYSFYQCGYTVLNEVTKNGYNIENSDMCFFPGIFMVRQSIELGLKALLCRSCQRNSEIQNIFRECRHNLSLLIEKYLRVADQRYLHREEFKWLEAYLSSLETVDVKSDVFRFAFEDDFLEKYKNKFIDNVAVGNNIIQAFFLIKKCLERGMTYENEKFNSHLDPRFFIFANNGFENCYLWQSPSEPGFYVKIKGYTLMIDYLFNNNTIDLINKLYPLLFMCRTTLELHIKQLFDSRINPGNLNRILCNKKKSHLLTKDLWANVKPALLDHGDENDQDHRLINVVEKQLNFLTAIDKKGDMFRYPTSYSLEYKFDNKVLDLKNVCEYMKALIHFFEAGYIKLSAMADFQADMDYIHNFVLY